MNQINSPQNEKMPTSIGNQIAQAPPKALANLMIQCGKEECCDEEPVDAVEPFQEMLYELRQRRQKLAHEIETLEISLRTWELASVLWETYRKSCGYLSLHGDDLPHWNQLYSNSKTSHLCEHWFKVAQASRTDSKS